ncbi:hypothetical protein [Pararhizobium arenae]|uniref:hypothetical protein n=1 Tax=Pararhizobium arenae TaxID=1856850 RepID=UPI000ACDB4FE|nr:hypothetical protein [Pararhizobium arenae]
MNDLREFAASSNGDRWFLGTDAITRQPFVLHRGNAPSGGHETRTSVDGFLRQQTFGPEREALFAMLDNEGGENQSKATDGEKTPSLKIAEEYLRLGGRRRAKVDDNIVSTRQWDDEPAEASEFWRKHVEPMDDKQRSEVEIHLRSMSDD